jgi:tetraacyldisaccharide 4'-kinase
MADPRGVEGIWYGDSLPARIARAALAPLGALYHAGAAVRGKLYDAGVLTTHASAIPAVSIGNLTVGGTGKTPFAAWLAGALAARGAHPAIVLRGYGDDEPLVHGILNPGIPVVVTPDRVGGIVDARARGADIVVLDDAFQHRRAARVADVVLVSADRWPEHPLLIPAGPFREPLSALRRATVIVITAKAARVEAVSRVRAAVSAAAPAVPVAVARLALGDLHNGDGSARRPLGSIKGAPVFAISAVGDPGAFAAQLANVGAVVRPSAFADHHAFTAGDAERLAAGLAPGETPICTLKDYVKLGPLWPRQASALWYVSQRLSVEENASAVDALVDSLLRARSIPSDTRADGPTPSPRS